MSQPGPCIGNGPGLSSVKRIVDTERRAEIYASGMFGRNYCHVAGYAAVGGVLQFEPFGHIGEDRRRQQGKD